MSFRIAEVGATLCAWFDVAEPDRAAFLEWHGREHMPERLRVPGFLRGTRFAALGQHSRDYLVIYEVASIATLASEPYIERLNQPTAWTERSVRLMTNQRRIAAAVVAGRRIGTGAAVSTLHLAAIAPIDAGALAAYLEAATARPGITAAWLCRTDEASSSIETAESRLGGHRYVPTECVLVVEAISPGALTDLGTAAQSDVDLRHIGLNRHGEPELFTLQNSVTAPDVSTFEHLHPAHTFIENVGEDQ